MKQKAKFTGEEQQQQQAAGLQQQQQAAREFASVEELLRVDAAHTAVPPAIAQRLSDSTADLPKPRRSWWRRLFDH